MPDGFDVAVNELEAFGAIGAVYAVYPYIRELLHRITGRAGVPPLLLDVLRLPIIHGPAEDAKGLGSASPAKRGQARASKSAVKRALTSKAAVTKGPKTAAKKAVAKKR